MCLRNLLSNNIVLISLRFGVGFLKFKRMNFLILLSLIFVLCRAVRKIPYGLKALLDNLKCLLKLGLSAHISNFQEGTIH